MIKLRGIIDRPEEPWQIIEKGVVPSTNKGFESVSTRRLQCYSLIGFDDC
jgi:hypothetical protein